MSKKQRIKNLEDEVKALKNKVYELRMEHITHEHEFCFAPSPGASNMIEHNDLFKLFLNRYGLKVQCNPIEFELVEKKGEDK